MKNVIYKPTDQINNPSPQEETVIKEITPRISDRHALVIGKGPAAYKNKLLGFDLIRLKGL